MKRAAYSFLLIALLSCGSSTPSSRSRVTVQFRDSIIQDYYLLSVRDNSLVVAPYSEEGETVSTLIKSASILPFENIDLVLHRGEMTPGDILLPASAIGVGGCIGGCYSGGGISLTGDGGGDHGSEYALYGLGIGCGIGAAAGYLISSQDREFQPSKKNDMEKLKNLYSFFKIVEPPELKKIK
jgi:hypothetical protein